MSGDGDGGDVGVGSVEGEVLADEIGLVAVRAVHLDLHRDVATWGDGPRCGRVEDDALDVGEEQVGEVGRGGVGNLDGAEDSFDALHRYIEAAATQEIELYVTLGVGTELYALGEDGGGTEEEGFELCDEGDVDVGCCRACGGTEEARDATHVRVGGLWRGEGGAEDVVGSVGGIEGRCISRDGDELRVLEGSLELPHAQGVGSTGGQKQTHKAIAIRGSQCLKDRTVGVEDAYFHTNEGLEGGLLLKVEGDGLVVHGGLPALYEVDSDVGLGDGQVVAQGLAVVVPKRRVRLLELGDAQRAEVVDEASAGDVSHLDFMVACLDACLLVPAQPEVIGSVERRGAPD